mmetsp:Transcript_38870/g.82696  ORF Transcript_38870/g.82696 Transcript_38870/m.82696 type:complete len:474 (+) Transcript_38870:64-1485(+)
MSSMVASSTAAATLPKIPAPVEKYGLKLDAAHFSQALLPVAGDEPLLTDRHGFYFRNVFGCAYPPVIRASVVERLRAEWRSRCDDVYLAFPGIPNLTDIASLVVALVEQRDLSLVDMSFPRWIEAAVARRGWGYVEAMDDWPCRRVFTSHAPPWLFPCGNMMSVRADTADGPSRDVAGATVPRIAVFVTDPRYFAVKHYRLLSHMRKWHTSDDTEEFKLSQYVEALIDTIDAGTVDKMCFVQFSGGDLVTALAWAYAEAENPERIRLFFLEDFVLQPEVALRGLARFLDVPMITAVTEAVERKAASVTRMAESSNLMQDTLDDLPFIGTISQYIRDFECTLAGTSDDIRAGWEDILKRWLVSPNWRMATIAERALQRIPWDPPGWWALHSARVCRPCLFFPRGTCDRVECAYCHGPDHAKPKRPSKAKRRARQQRYDRTPSPEPYLPLVAEAAPTIFPGWSWLVAFPVYQMQG